MLNNIVIGKYYAIKSKVHDMNPVAKILSIIIFLVITLASNDLTINLVTSIIILLVIGLTHVPIKVYLKALYGMRVLIAVVIILNLVVKTPTEAIAIMVLRLVTLLLYTTILTLTTTPNDIAYGLEKVLEPFKLIGVPVRRIAFSLSVALRFIPTIVEQSNRVLKTQASRGVDYKHANLSGKIYAVRLMLIPMFISSFKRADDLASAMEVKLYDFKTKRTNYRISKWKIFDHYIVLMHLLIAAAIILRGVIK